MLNNMSLGITLLAKDEFSRVFGQLNTAFTTLEGKSDEFIAKMERNGRQLKLGLALMGTGIAGLGASFAAANEAGKFEGAMTNLQVVSGATTKQMEEFKKALLGADKSMFGPVESAEALQELAQRGFTARQALEMLKPITDLASASLGQLGITQSAEVATMAIHGFGLKAEDTAAVVDKMAKAANMSGMAFKDLPLGIGAIARGAQAANQTFDESLIVLGMMRNSIHSIERASNAGSVAMERMVSGTKGARELQAMANVFDKSTGQVRPFREINNDLIPKLDAMGTKASKAFIIKSFGTRGLAGVEAVITQLKNGIEIADGTVVKGLDLIRYQNEQLAKSMGTAAAITEARLKTLPGQIALIKAEFERLAVVVGEPFAQVLKPVVEGILKVATFLKSVFMGMPENVKKTLATFFLVGSAIATVVGGLIAAKAIMGLFGMTLAGLASGALALAGPLAVIAAGVGAVILLFQALRVHSEQTGGGVLGFFSNLAGKISLAFRGLMQAFQLGGFSGAIMEELNRAENSGVKAFAIKVYVWVYRIKHFLDGMVEGFSERVRALQPTFDRLVDVLKSVADMLGFTVGSAKDNLEVWNDMGSAGSSLGQILADVAGVLSNAFATAITVVMNAAKIAGQVWAAVGPAIMGAAKIIWSGIQFVVGVLTGDWDAAWRGAFGLVYGLADRAIDIVGRLIKIMTFIPRSLGGLLGVNFGVTDAINRQLEQEHKIIAEAKTEAMSMAGLKGDAEFDVNAPKGPRLPAPSLMNSPMVGVAQGWNMLTNSERGAPAAPSAPLPQTINLTALLNLDGATLARLQQQIRTDAAARGFSMVPAGVAP